MLKPTNHSRRKFLLESLLLAAGLPACQADNVFTSAPTATSTPGTSPANSTGNTPVSTSNVHFLLRNDAEYAKHRQIFNKRITAMPKVIAVCSNEKACRKPLPTPAKPNCPSRSKAAGIALRAFLSWKAA